MSNTTSSNNLSFLAGCGSTLSTLLRSAKCGDANGSESDIHDKVESAISRLLNDLNSVCDTLIDESMVMVMSKIEGTLDEFVKFDPINGVSYKELIDKVKRFKPGSASTMQSNSDSDSSHQLVLNFESGSESESESAYRNLGHIERQCLLWFSMFPEGTVLRKKVLLDGWIGMGLIFPTLDGGEKALNSILTLVVTQGFIELVILKQKSVVSSYKMRTGVRAKVIELSIKESWSHNLTKKDGFFMIQRKGSAEIKALYNTREQILNTKIWDWFSKMNKLEVMHLGSWKKQNAEYNVIVEDIGSLKVFRHIKYLTVLSFQGVSGLTELPASVCKLENLEVLDLRRCNDLELLPEEIGLLQRLTHLDLSECYLLDHIPKQVSSLSNLQLLKGFVTVQPAHAGSNSLKTKRFPCLFSELSELKNIRKLTVHTRRMDFPTRQDLETLNKMQWLSNLGIEWVGSSDDVPADCIWDETDIEFVRDLKKLKLQAIPGRTASRLLGLIALGSNCPQKLDIRGGELQDLGQNEHSFILLQEVCLKYLENLHMDWREFRKIFPNVTRLQIFGCPNLILFPCDDDGVWESDE